jgi:hypothetical protein
MTETRAVLSNTYIQPPLDFHVAKPTGKEAK